MLRSPAFVRRSLFVVGGVLLLAVGPVAACGDDDDPAEDTKTTSTRPEDVKVPMSEVVAKLPDMVSGGEKAAGAAVERNFDTASQEYEELHEVWEQVEGTVKDTDLDAYEKIETAQGLLRDGAENENADRVKRGADDQAAAVKAFIRANGS